MSAAALIQVAKKILDGFYLTQRHLRCVHRVEIYSGLIFYWKTGAVGYTICFSWTKV